MDVGLLPTEEQIYGAIEEIFSHGVRRPGYEADRWAEEYAKEAFTSLGLENARFEPVELPYWAPRVCARRRASRPSLRSSRKNRASLAPTT